MHTRCSGLRGNAFEYVVHLCCVFSVSLLSSNVILLVVHETILCLCEVFLCNGAHTIYAVLDAHIFDL
uniref:Uncharacterized protein n=1 Tax=Arundo donax TaxID=35708 RepID=A0A0A9F8V0_ARUDO